MNESALSVYERTENLKSTRTSGFIPGVLYGGGFEKGVPVKLEDAKFQKIIHTNGSNAKVWIEFNGERHFGMIKDLQKDSLNGKIIHVDIRMLSQADDVRIKLPILFTGINELEHNNLKLKIQNNQIDASGQAGMLPEHITVNVENMKPGDIIRVEDLKLNNTIKVHDPLHEIYAVAVEIKGAGDEGGPSA